MPTGRISAFPFWNAFRILRRGRSDSHLFQLLYWAVLISVILSLHTAVVFKHSVLYWNLLCSGCSLSRVLMNCDLWDLCFLASSLSSLSSDLTGWVFIRVWWPQLLSHHRIWTVCGFILNFRFPKLLWEYKRNPQESAGLPLRPPILWQWHSPPWQLEGVTQTMLHSLCFQSVLYKRAQLTGSRISLQ